ncbi:hypothetical protein [Streptomyces sp. NBC_01455]|uniref:hypothetical protein n=1 Tax=Streptomyces sp. NBC_01455 TaxID=2903874 RepID=UPI002E371F9C|nr:hypothetical protein [Streptomyces sp. NBC_01455]
MSTLALLVVLPLVLVVIIVVVAVGYAAHRFPALRPSIAAGFTALMALVATISLIFNVGGAR